MGPGVAPGRWAAVALAASALCGWAPAAGAGATPEPPAPARGMVVGPDPTLLVTFDDRPGAAVALTRLAGLGTAVPLVPEAGVWAVRGTAPATLRRRALARSHVAVAEWSLVRRSLALTDPPAPPPPALPALTLPDPADPIFTDASRSWHLHTGTWSFGLSAYDRPTIAILDSGLALSHEEWSAPGLVVFPHTVFPARTDVEDIEEAGHGTHVTGIAAAPANGVGVVGVAPASASSLAPGVSKVMPVQVNDRRGFTTDAAMMAGIRWAVEHGARVINISSGGRGGLVAFQQTVDWAFGHGVLIVAAAGNDGLDFPAGIDAPVEFPAGYDHVIGVAAQCDGTPDAKLGCDAPFTRARFSDANASVDLVAPGVRIASTIPTSVTTGQIAPGYGLLSGTSMAAPFVAGTAALVFASHPGITPFQVTRILESTADRAAAGLPRTDGDGWGIVNSLAAAQAQAPVDDLSEPNDDATLHVRANALRPSPAPVALSAWADANDDPVDVYAVDLVRGERLRVTLASASGLLREGVYRPGLRTLYAATPAQGGVRLLRGARVVGPGTESVVVRARETGRHLVVVRARAGGGRYALTLALAAGTAR